MVKFRAWVMAATLVSGASLFTACGNDVVDNPVPPEKTIAIDKANFPDDNFREYLLDQDYGQDGVLTETEIMFIDDMDVYDMEISSLQGIEYFTALTVLDCEENELTTLDVSKNTALKQLYCGDNYLTSLDVSNNVALVYLDCYCNELTSLDVSKNTALESLDCDENKLTTLDVSKNTALKSLTIDDNEITSIDVSNLTDLDYFSCDHTQITSLDVSNNPNLRRLFFIGNQLTSIDISNNTKLVCVFCDGNQLTSLDFTNNPLLYFVSLTRNKISGQNMDAIVTALAQNDNPDAYIFDVIDNSNGDEGNVCTKSQVAALKAKGWKPRYYDEEEDDWTEYEGSDE